MSTIAIVVAVQCFICAVVAVIGRRLSGPVRRAIAALRTSRKQKCIWNKYAMQQLAFWDITSLCGTFVMVLAFAGMFSLFLWGYLEKSIMSYVFAGIFVMAALVMILSSQRIQYWEGQIDALRATPSV